MKVYKFNTIYPRTLWIVNYTDDYRQLTNRFIFYLNKEGWNEINKDIADEFETAGMGAIAGCYVVEEKSTGVLGLLLVIFDINSMDTSIVAHESVHIADYYYEVTGCNSEDFTDGNEAYAYLVGWIACCVSNVLIKEKNETK